MAIDKAPVDEVVDGQIADLERRFGDACEIRSVCLVMEVARPGGSELAIGASTMPDFHATARLLRTALEAMDRLASGEKPPIV